MATADLDAARTVPTRLQPRSAGTPAIRALLADGKIVELSPLGPADADPVLALHQRLSEHDRYLRFFSSSDYGAAKACAMMTRPDGADHAAIGASLDGTLIGVAHYEVLDDPTVAEMALAVDGTAQAHGVGTLLLEHLGSAARRAGVRRFVAEVLAENVAMLRVFADLGLRHRTVQGGGAERRVEILLDPDDDYADAVRDRERVADVASLAAVLRPARIVVVGAGRRPGSVGHAVLRNLVDGGYSGELYAVNPHASQIAGVPCVADPAQLPDAPDLAVICVPADAVAGAVDACGKRGTRAVLVISAGVTGTDQAAALVDAVRAHGMRLVGPNCVGVINTEPDVAMNATFAVGPVPAGSVGVVTQSGGVGITLIELLRQLDLGVSTLVSTGDKYDVSGNDLLLWWARDPATSMAVLYLESFGNPRKFSRLARALSATKPVLTVRSASSAAAQQAAASHTAAAATPAVIRDALLAQAGVIAVDTVSELVDVIVALTWSPLPAGNRVAVLSNAGGTGVLAADACVHNGLMMSGFEPSTVASLRAVLSDQASVHNPIDTTATVDVDTYLTCLDLLLADPNVDAVIAAGVPIALGDPISAVDIARRGTDKPVLVVRPGQLAAVTSVPAVADLPDGQTRRVPSYADPAAAATALAHLAEYADWRRRESGPRTTVDVDASAALAVVRDHLRGGGDGWLSAGEVGEVLACFGIPMVRTLTCRDDEEAMAAFAELGGPVVVKAVADGVLHKSAAGGVVLDIRDADQLRTALTGLRDTFGGALRGTVVQPMIPAGRELLVGISADERFGPLVVLALGGVDTDLIADRVAHLTPLSEADAHEMVHGLRSSARLFGAEAARPQPVEPVVDVLRRVAALADLLPEVVELDLNPVRLNGDRVVILDARIRVAPVVHSDPLLRQLRV